MKFLTNLIFEPQGKHDSSLAYNIKDTVMSADGSKVYFALQDVPAGTALSNTDYWMLQIDLSSTKSAMEDALASFGNYAKEIGTRVKGETAMVSGNPVTCLADAGSLLQPVTVLEPKQEGSGDPYPAGGGKNLLPCDATTRTVSGVTFTVNSDGSITIKGTASAQIIYTIYGATLNFPAGNYIATQIPNGVNEKYYATFYTKADNSSRVDIYGSDKSFTIEEGGCVQNFRIVVREGAVIDLTFYPMIRLASDSNATYAPYSNIRPISGWDAVSMTAAGLNLAPTFKDFPKIGMTFKETDGKITISGTATGTGRLDSARIILPPGTYTLTPNYSALINASIYMRTPGGIQFGTISMAANLDRKSTFTVTEPTEATVSMFINSGATADNFTLEAILVAGSDRADFKTYNGEKYTVQIGQTVYGGRMDWLTGKLVAELAMKTLDGTEDYTQGSGGVLTKITDAADPVPGGVDAWCSHYKRTTSTNQAGIADMEFAMSHKSVSGTPRLYIRDSVNCPDVSTGQAYIAAQYAAGTPVQIVYKLATPIEIQLTPTIISAVEPEQTNTLYGDGSIDVEYVKPLHVSIEERVAAAVAAAMQT